jgi:hypothetical protein
MAKHTVSGALYLHTSSAQHAPKDRSYYFTTSDFSKTGDFIKVVDCSFDVQIPDDFDPVPEVIASLTEQKRQLRLKLAAELADLDERISKLSALTFEGAAA